MYIFVTYRGSLENDIWAGRSHCPACSTETDFYLKRFIRRAFLFGFIPLFSSVEKRFLTCDSCTASKELKAKEYRKIRKEQVEKLERRELPEEIVKKDFSAKSLKMWAKYTKLVFALLFAAFMVFMSAGLASIGKLYALAFSIVMFLPIGLLPLYFVLSDFIFAQKKLKYYKEVMSGNVQYVSETKQKSKLGAKCVLALILSLFVLLPIVSYAVSDKDDDKDTDKGQSGTSDTTSIQEQIKIPCIYHTYEDGDVISEPTYREKGTKKTVCKDCGYESTATIPVLNAVEISVTNKVVFEYNDESIVTGESVLNTKRIVMFDIHIKNISDANITSVKGDIVFEIGAQTLTLTCDFNEQAIAVGETVTYSAWGFEYKPHLEPSYTGVFAKNALYEAELEDVSVSFKTTETVFEDQTQESN